MLTPLRPAPSIAWMPKRILVGGAIFRKENREMAKEKEIKFPFKPNECVVAAFRQEAQLKRAIVVMTEALAKVAADAVDPWDILMREHPELMEGKRRAKFRYSGISETIDLVVL